MQTLIDLVFPRFIALRFILRSYFSGVPDSSSQRKLLVFFVGQVLEGSVRKVGDQLRITARLVDTKSRDRVWAKRFDVSACQLFEVQDKIMRKIVTALNVELVRGSRPAAGTFSYTHLTLPTNREG